MTTEKTTSNRLQPSLGHDLFRLGLVALSAVAAGVAAAAAHLPITWVSVGAGVVALVAVRRPLAAAAIAVLVAARPPLAAAVGAPARAAAAVAGFAQTHPGRALVAACAGSVLVGLAVAAADLPLGWIAVGALGAVAAVVALRPLASGTVGWTTGHVNADATGPLGLTLETVVRPYTLLVLGGALSFLAWAIPSRSDVPSVVRGFAHREPFTVSGGLFLLGWYAFFFLMAIGGFWLGRRIPVLRRAERVPWESFYLFLTVLAVIGTVYSYGYVFVKSPHLLGYALHHQQFAQVRRLLPESAGVPTLRYASSLSAAIGIFELMRRRLRALHVLNIILLLLTAAVAARICLIIAAVAVAGLAARHLRSKRIDTTRLVGVLVLGLVGLFLALAALNYSRNADFYRQNNVRGPLAMNVDEMIRYLGVPFQASVAVSNHVGRWPMVPETARAGAKVFLLPTYLSSSTPASVGKAENRYRSLVTVPTTLTTNSVLAAAYGVLGILSFPILGIVALVAAVIAGYASRYRSYIFLAGLVVAYCFAEWWRVYIFNAGLIQFLVLALAFWGLVGASADRWTGGRWSRLTDFLLSEDRRRGWRRAPRQT